MIELIDAICATPDDDLRALPKLRRLELADMRDVPVEPLDLEELSLPEWTTTSVFGWS